MSETAGNLVIITTTSDDRDELENIATALVEERLAACCQISQPIQSIYVWQGSVASEQEFSCAIKTTQEHVEAIKSKIREMHKYDLPQIIVVNAADVCDHYLNWVRTETRR